MALINGKTALFSIQGGFLCTYPPLSHIYMDMLLQEIALHYWGGDIRQIFWDYFAMYDLFKKVGNNPEAPVNSRREEMITHVYEQVADAFVKKLLSAFTQRKKISLREDATDKEVVGIIRKLYHAWKLKNYEEMHAAIGDLLRLQEKTSLEISEYDALTIPPADIKTQRKMSLSNPARYLTRVSPMIARLIKANLQYFGPAAGIPGELGKSEKVISAPRGEWTPEEKPIVTKLGFNIVAAGNALASTKSGERVYFDKLKTGTFLFFNNDKSIIEEFPSLEEAGKFLAKNYRKKLPVRGYDRTSNGLSTPAPAKPLVMPPKPVVPPPVPTDIPALPNIFDPREAKRPKRLAANWETLLETFGYTWSEEASGYRNGEKLLQVGADNSAYVFDPNGKNRSFANLGLLFRDLAHNKDQQPALAGQPKAQVTEANYKELFQFLYS